MEHIRAGVVGKGEAGTGVTPGLIGLNGVLQAAGLPDDGHRAVAHGDHLGKAAGLAAGGHQEQIRTCVDSHGQCLIIPQTHSHTAGIPLRRPAEELLISGIAAAQHHKLSRQLHDVAHDLPQKIQSLMGYQTAHHGDNGGVWLLVQTHQVLESGFIRSLAGQILRRIVGSDASVSSRIVELHIDAVEHAGQLIAALGQNALHPVSKVGILQLLRIGGGHGVHRVSGEDGALQQIQIAVQQQGAVIHPAPVQAEQVAQAIGVIASLILDVVDSQHRPDRAIPVLPDAVILQINGNQGRLPVIAVDHIRPELQMVQHLHHGPGEEAEALSVIYITVELGPVKILLVIQEIPGHAVLFHGKQAAVGVPPGQIHIIVAQECQLVSKFFSDPPVQRQDHSGLGSLLRQSGRQGTGYVCQSAGFTEGNGLAGRIQNLHILLLLS